jgi:hypothetical protein
MFLAIDRVSKFTFVAFYDKAGKMNAAACQRHFESDPGLSISAL